MSKSSPHREEHFRKKEDEVQLSRDEPTPSNAM